MPSNRILTPEEVRCERLFVETHSRDADGRYIIRLFKKDDSIVLGSSRAGALRVLLSMERRAERDSMLKQSYIDFMATLFSRSHGVGAFR